MVGCVAVSTGTIFIEGTGFCTWEMTNWNWQTGLNIVDTVVSFLSLILFSHRAYHVRKEFLKVGISNSQSFQSMYRTFIIHTFLGVLTCLGSLGIFFCVLFLDILVGFTFAADAAMNSLLVFLMFSQNEWLLSKLCCFCRKRLLGETEMTAIKDLKQQKQMRNEKQMEVQSPNTQQQQEPTKSSKSKPSSVLNETTSHTTTGVSSNTTNHESNMGVDIIEKDNKNATEIDLQIIYENNNDSKIDNNIKDIKNNTNINNYGYSQQYMQQENESSTTATATVTATTATVIPVPTNTVTNTQTELKGDTFISNTNANTNAGVINDNDEFGKNQRNVEKQLALEIRNQQHTKE